MSQPNLMLIWHLHQPPYRAPGDDLFSLPWVRLHTIREYHDMARMLEDHPSVSVTVNWSPILIQQIQTYAEGTQDQMQQLRDREASSLEPAERLDLLKGSIRAHPDTMIDPHPRFAEIRDEVQNLDGNHTDQVQQAADLPIEMVRDAQVWSTLTWFGFDARDQYPKLNAMMEQGQNFDETAKEPLRSIETELLQDCLDRWKTLASKQPIELSVNPYYHPIGPLLTNYTDVEQGLPDAALPERTIRWPEDARWHLRQARQIAKKAFNLDKPGLWPSEGSISPDFLDLVAEEGFAWAASDEALLERSHTASGNQPTSHLAGYRYQDQLPLFFRDHKLSDRIGFDYARQPTGDALDDFLGTIQNARPPKNGPYPVPVILDGENPWEYFEDAGRSFLDGLYGRLETSEQINSTTPKQWINRTRRPDLIPLSTVGSGSWIHGNFAIWAGHKLDVRAWDLLAETREALSSWDDLDEATKRDCWRSLYGAQASDWFWWYGEPFSAADDDVFDQLFRQHLIQVYKLAGRTPPSYLYHQMQTSLEPQYEPPRQFISPSVDGTDTQYREWWGAALIRQQQQNTMARVDQYFEKVRLGSDKKNLYGRVDFETSPDPEACLYWQLNGHELFFGPFKDGQGTIQMNDRTLTNTNWVYDQLLEWELPLDETNLQPGEYCEMALELRHESSALERLPFHNSLTVPLLDRKSQAREWTV